MIATTKGFTRWAGLILAVSLPLISTQAHAVTVTVGTQTYELGSVTGSFNDNSALLQTQVWWSQEAGDGTLAVQFADAAKIANALFAFQIVSDLRVEGGSFRNYGSGFLEASSATVLRSATYTYMTATLSPSSVPEINAGSLSQALLILFALWLVTWRRPASRVA